MSVRAATPVTITFEDIFNKPYGYDVLPPFTWRGVGFTGGGLHQTETLGTWYEGRNRSVVEIQFPPGSTDVSFDVDGRGGSLILFEYMPLQVWNGYVGSGTVIANVPLPSSILDMRPPKHKITIPGPISQITIFTSPPPSGISTFYNTIVVDNIRYTPPDPEPTITFDLSSAANERVLIHNYGNHPYPSLRQTQDGAIRVEAAVRVNNQPAPGKTIHFRLQDPADTAPYAKQAGDASLDDNFDGPGSLNGTGNTTATAVSDASGRIAVTLHVSSFASGDNYQVEASGNANFTCGTSCAKSAVYTAWKRVYVEYNKMFRRGAYITADVAPGAKKIEVSNVNIFPNPPFDIRLIHAPPVKGTGGTAGFYSETVTITKTEANGTWPFGVRPGVLRLDPDPAIPGVQYAYFKGEAVAGNPAIRPYLADAVGLVTGNRSNDHILLDTRFIKPVFDEAFVEHVWLTDAVAGADSDLDPQDLRESFDGVIPHNSKLDHPDKFEREWLTLKWIHHAQRVGQDRISDPNHFAVFTATNHETADGLTSVGSRFNDLWLFTQKIGNTIQMAESLVHELGHEWRVNGVKQPGVPGAGLPGGHCNVSFGSDQKMYNRNLKCSMHSSMYADQADPEPRDGIVGFHYVRVNPTAVDSEYLRIRRRQEPVPQNEQQRTPPQ